VSDIYLNDELSLELKKLGVAFPPNKYELIKEIEGVHIVKPHTAQLIDKLREIGGWGRLLFNSAGYAIRTSQTDTTIFTCLDDYQCATTALGEALIKLTKEQNDG